MVSVQLHLDFEFEHPESNLIRRHYVSHLPFNLAVAFSRRQISEKGNRQFQDKYQVGVGAQYASYLRRHRILGLYYGIDQQH
jgi:hypothetical protein